MTVTLPEIFNLIELQAELVEANVDVGDGLIQNGDELFRVLNKQPAPFVDAEEDEAQAVCDAHVPQNPPPVYPPMPPLEPIPPTEPV